MTPARTLRALALRAALPAALALTAAAQGQTQSATLYQQSFDGGQMSFPEWSSNTIVNVEDVQRFTRFNGRYSGGWTQLTLAGPPPLIQGRSIGGPGNPPGGGGSGGGGGGENPPGPGGPSLYYQFVLKLDLYILDSWDAVSLYGEDRFYISANNTTIFNETFANQPGIAQSFRAPDVGPAMLGFDSRYLDSIYRNVQIPFTVADPSTLRIRFFDSGLQGLNDESWGIDNVSLSYTVVPAPGALALAGLGALCIARRRR